MKKYEKNIVDFFMGANTPQGFFSQFDKLFDPNTGYHTYIIKAGSGFGKSTMMKQIGTSMAKKGHQVEFVRCTADPESLDAMVCHDLKFVIADGTAPHVVEPKYPGVHETVLSFYQYADPTKLKGKLEKLLEVDKKKKELLNQSTRFTVAANSIVSDTAKIVDPHIDKIKLVHYAETLSKKLFKKKSDKYGDEQVRFLSAVTNKGKIFFGDTPQKLAKTIYAYHDEYGCVSNKIIAILKERALEAGYDIIACYNHWSPVTKVEHLFIPELELGFITIHDFNKINFKPFRTIHAKRFLDLEELKSVKNRLRFNKKTISLLTDKIISLQQEVRKQHLQVEEIFVPAVDFEPIDKITKQIIKKHVK